MEIDLRLTRGGCRHRYCSATCSSIAGKPMFSFIKKPPTFQSAFQQVSLALHHDQQLVLSGAWIVAILIGVWWYLSVLTCNFLMSKDMNHSFICLFAIRISSLMTHWIDCGGDRGLCGVSFFTS